MYACYTSYSGNRTGRPLCSFVMITIGPLHDPVTWYGKLCWNAINAVGLPKQRNSYQTSLTFLCFEMPMRYLRPRIIYSVPCDLILLRACYHFQSVGITIVIPTVLLYFCVYIILSIKYIFYSICCLRH